MSRERSLPTEEPIQPGRAAVVALLLLPLIIPLWMNTGMLLEKRGDVSVGAWKVQLADAARDAEILIVGDSSSVYGVVPERLTERTGLRAVNLGTQTGALVLSDAWLLRRALDAGARPKVVVVVHALQQWTIDEHDPSFSAFLSELPLAPWQIRSLDPPPPPVAGLLHQVAVTRWLPAYSNVTDQADRWLKFWERARRRERGALPLTREPLGNLATERGLPPDFAEQVDQRAAEYAAWPGGLTPVTEQALRAALGLAREHGIPVIQLHCPVVQDLADHPETERYVAQLNAALTRIHAEERAGRMVTAIRTFPTEAMEGLVHLRGVFPRDYTDWIAEQIEPEIGTR